MVPAKMREKIDLGPFAHLPLRRVSAGLLSPALACKRWQYQSTSLSAEPSNGRSRSPSLPILGRMIHVVVLDLGFAGALRGGSAPVVEVDHAEGVDWRGGVARLSLPGLGFVGRPAAAAKESLVCWGAPGLLALWVAVRYWLIVSALLHFLEMSTLYRSEERRVGKECLE